MAPISQTPRERLLKLLSGSSMILPDINTLLRPWPQAINPNLDRVHYDTEMFIESLFPVGKRRDKMKAGKFTEFAATWWPRASYEALRTATYLSIWLFAWDDETDSQEFSSLSANMNRGEAYRAETVEFIRASISGNNALAMKKSSDPIIRSFEIVGDAVALSFTEAQAARLLYELELFIHMTGVEQEQQVSGVLPSVEVYQQRRMGSTAIGVCLAMTEYCNGIEIPVTVMRDPDIRAIWDETNINVSVTNDILSLKKEVAQGEVDSLVPLLLLQHGSLQAAVDTSMDILRSSFATFETASRQLFSRYANDEELTAKLEQFVEACKYACTGNLNWSRNSGRYNLDCESLSEQVCVTL